MLHMFNLNLQCTPMNDHCDNKQEISELWWMYQDM